MSFKIVKTTAPMRRTEHPPEGTATARRRRVATVLVTLLAALLCTVSRATTAVPASAVPTDTVRRVLTMLEAAAEDYREGVRDGAVVRPVELEESVGFIDEAQQRIAALSLAPDTASELRMLFGELHTAIDGKAPAERVAEALATVRERLAAATGVSPLAYAPATPSAARGQSLFADNCVTCHGEHGDGKGPSATQLHPPPANFTDPAFMRGETPYDFFHVVSLGKHNTAMPAWDSTLSVQDRWDLVAYLWTLAPGTAGLAEGQGVYLTQCASCHGARADGHGTFADVLVTAAGDLSHPPALAQRTDAELFAVTTDGRPGSPMPAFAHTLSADERWKAVAFLRALSLGGALPVAGSPGGSPGADGTRLAGLLRLLGREYAAAWSGDQLARPADYDEASALAAQAVRSADSFTAALESQAPDAARRLRADLGALVAAIHARASTAQVSSAVEALAALIQAQAPTVPGALAVGDQPRAVVDAGPVDAALAESARLVAVALDAYARGDGRATSALADAYLEFEPLEQRLGATAPGLKTTVEDHFMQLRQHLRLPNDEAAVHAAADSISTDFAAVRTALQPHTSPYALFLESATIILREGFEMVLVIGALLAYVVKSGNLPMRTAIYSGTVAGVVASLATAAVMGELLRLHPNSSDMLEGITMLLAAVMLFWVSYWLISKTEADRWQRYIRGKVQSAVSGRRNLALAGAAFLAVYREGFETVLFYQALYASAPAQSVTVTAGFIAGTVALAAVYVAFRRFQVQIPIQQFFFATGLLLYAMAAVFAGQGVHELQDAGIIGVTAVPWVPTIPLLGIFPSLQSLATQALFVSLLVYATAVALRRRHRAADAATPSPLVIELQALRQAIEAVREELNGLRGTTTPRATAPEIRTIEEHVTGVLLQVERLAGTLATPATAEPTGGVRNRH